MEFMKFKDINAEAVNQALKMEVGGLLRMGPGQITDDCEMDMCLDNALTNSKDGKLDLNAI